MIAAAVAQDRLGDDRGDPLAVPLEQRFQRVGVVPGATSSVSPTAAGIPVDPGSTDGASARPRSRARDAPTSGSHPTSRGSGLRSARSARRPVNARANRSAYMAASVPELENRTRSTDGIRSTPRRAASPSRSWASENSDPRSAGWRSRRRSRPAAVAQDQRPLAHHVVDVAVSVLIGQPAPDPSRANTGSGSQPERGERVPEPTPPAR